MISSGAERLTSSLVKNDGSLAASIESFRSAGFQRGWWLMPNAGNETRCLHKREWFPNRRTSEMKPDTYTSGNNFSIAERRKWNSPLTQAGMISQSPNVGNETRRLHKRETSGACDIGCRRSIRVPDLRFPFFRELINFSRPFERPIKWHCRFCSSSFNIIHHTSYVNSNTCFTYFLIRQSALFFFSYRESRPPQHSSHRPYRLRFPQKKWLNEFIHSIIFWHSRLFL